MDLNKLYFDHQVSLLKARRAQTPALRHGHQAEAARLAADIWQGQNALGAAAACGWVARGEQSAA